MIIFVFAKSYFRIGTGIEWELLKLVKPLWYKNYGIISVQQSKKDPPKNVVSLDEALNLLMGAFLRGGTSFLKGEIIKSGSGANREVRVCVTNVSMEH